MYCHRVTVFLIELSLCFVIDISFHIVKEFPFPRVFIVIELSFRSFSCYKLFLFYIIHVACLFLRQPFSVL